MYKKKRVDFSEIFHYAEEKFNVDWNRANDMFFNNSLNYKSFNEFFDGTSEYYDGEKKFIELDESDKGYYIINQYMKDNDIDELFVDNR